MPTSRVVISTTGTSCGSSCGTTSARADDNAARPGARRIHLLRGEIDEYYANFRSNRDLLELRNLVGVAELVVRSALARHESRGLHFSRDYPYTLRPASRRSSSADPARPDRGSAREGYGAPTSTIRIE